jgi:hypothetical protein
MLPLLVFVLIQSRPPNVHASIAYMRHFCPTVPLLSSSAHSELQYRLANLEAAAAYIESGQLLQQIRAASSTRPSKARTRVASVSVRGSHTLQQLLTPDSFRSQQRRVQAHAQSRSALLSRSTSLAAKDSSPSSSAVAPSALSRALDGEHVDRVDEADESAEVDESVDADHVLASSSGASAAAARSPLGSLDDDIDGLFDRRASQMRLQRVDNSATAGGTGTTSAALFGTSLDDGALELTGASALPDWLTRDDSSLNGNQQADDPTHLTPSVILPALAVNGAGSSHPAAATPVVDVAAASTPQPGDGGPPNGHTPLGRGSGAAAAAPATIVKLSAALKPLLDEDDPLRCTRRV